MVYDVRPIGPEEIEDFARVGNTAFGFQGSDQALEHLKLGFEYDRSLVALDGGRMVGTAGAFSFGLTLPGLATTPVAAVSFVGVLPTHRRRGVLTALMRCQLEDVRERGEPLAILTASESAIYGRFGYGIATLSATYILEREHSALRPEAAMAVADDKGQVRLVDQAEARAVFPVIHDANRRRQPGQLALTDGFWDAVVREEPWQDTKGSRFLAVHEGAGGPDALAEYYFDRNSDGALSRSRVDVHTLVASDPQAELAMFAYLCGIDLVHDVAISNRPVDEPFRWCLADPRRLRTRHLYDFLWVRPVDVAAALAARRYRVAGRIVVELLDDWMSGTSGAWVLDGGPDGAQAGPARGAEPDIVLGAAELGSILLGGVAPSRLARVGRITELSAGALAKADAMFGIDPAPWCSTEF